MGRAVDFVKTFVVSIGMVTDAYEVFLMNIVSIILANIYGKTSYSSSLTVTILVGMAIGQLLFGFLGDAIGRKPMFIVTAIFLIFFSVASSLIFPIIFEEPYIGLAIVRFFLGIGIGGEYPLSSAITAESSTQKGRSKKMVFIFTMRGIGNLLAPLVVMILLFTPLKLDLVWRIAFALGSIPCLITLYFRFSLDFPNKVREPQQKLNIKRVLLHNWKPLLGTAGTWFLFDIAFYGNSMCNANILEIIGFAGKNSTNEYEQRQSLITNSIGNIILTAVAFPGFVVAWFVVNKISKRWLQIGGFIGTAVCYIIMAAAGKQIIEKAPYIYVIIYGLSFFFQNLGPNTMTYILSTEVYDRKIRSTFSGISAAAGKVGAMIGTAVFDPFTEAFGVEWTFGTCAALMVVGVFLTFFIPSKPHTDDEPTTEVENIPSGETSKEDGIELQVSTPTTSTPTPTTAYQGYAFSPASPADTLQNPGKGDMEKIFEPILHNQLNNKMKTEEKKQQKGNQNDQTTETGSPEILEETKIIQD